MHFNMVLIIENDFWGRKKRNLDLLDDKGGSIEANLFRLRALGNAKFTLISWVIYTYSLKHCRFLSPRSAKPTETNFRTRTPLR